jgi:raffinose/stachyose/melibiose transport system permease protein
MLPESTTGGRKTRRPVSEPLTRESTGSLRRRGPTEVPWLLALPGIAALILFHFVPIAFGGFYAFTNWNGLTRAEWVGLANFRDIFADPPARAALWHTLELGVCFVVIVNAIGLTLAIALNPAVKTRHFLRALFFAPVALSPLAIAFIWQWIFDYRGALNRLLAGVGLGSWRHVWLGDPSTALWSILVVMVWQFSGLAMVLYLAGLQGISDEVHEAALVDGASGLFRLRKVVLPLLAPAITVSTTITLIIGLRVFEQVMALTHGGPVDATETLGTQVYKQTFFLGRFAYGAAFALILTTLIAVLALTQLALLRKNEERL